MKPRQIFTVAAAILASAAFAHGDSQHSAAHQFDPDHVEATSFGQQGDPKKVTRTIRVEMNDRMRFVPDDVTVKKGDTVRFVVANKGAVLHEMVLGTAGDLARHAQMMQKFPGMEHDDANMTHVTPGAKGEIVWQFTQPGEFQFACLVPGHYEAGMVGKVVVK